ncbi:MAG: hypothetical protein AMXMBFR53_41950 [Gemmatimonadota bacterium]
MYCRACRLRRKAPPTEAGATPLGRGRVLRIRRHDAAGRVVLEVTQEGRAAPVGTIAFPLADVPRVIEALRAVATN